MGGHLGSDQFFEHDKSLVYEISRGLAITCVCMPMGQDVWAMFRPQILSIAQKAGHPMKLVVVNIFGPFPESETGGSYITAALITSRVRWKLTLFQRHRKMFLITGMRIQFQQRASIFIVIQILFCLVFADENSFASFDTSNLTVIPKTGCLFIYVPAI